MRFPIIGITMGDLAGIGPEVTAKALRDKKILSRCVPVVIGSKSFFLKTIRDLKISLDIVEPDAISREGLLAGKVYFINAADVDPREVKLGAADARWGKKAFLYVEKGTQYAMNGVLDAIVTAPINKEGIRKAGYEFEGHTDFLAHLTGTRKYWMMFAGGGLKVILATIHIPLKEVFKRLNEKTLLETIEASARAATLFGIDRPRIAVCGLNPHAGEGGLFGDEENKIVIPAVNEAKRKGINASGPLPPDTVFLSAHKGEFDIVVALYHDQGLIAFKMVAFDKGVNLTLGLPLIRTSPDHGTAYNIAGKGIADPGSMKEAITMAANLAINSKVL